MGTRPDITFNRQGGGLGRPLPGQDHYSGFIVYEDSLPTGFGTDKIKQVFSIDEAEALGVTSDDAVFKFAHYHVSEFFRMNPKGVLWLMVEPVPAVPASRTWSEITEIQNFSEGLIRQVGIFDDVAAFDSADLTKIQVVIVALQTDKQPLSVVLGSDISGTADLSALSDLRALVAPNVSVCIAESGSVVAQALVTESSKSLTSVGNCLGTISLAQVNEDIAWPKKFRIDNGEEMAIALIANGDNIRDLSSGLLDSIHDKGYIIPRKFVGSAFTYYTDSPTAVAVTSDFAYIENNRTIDKAIRGLRIGVQPELNSPLKVNSDGTLSDETIAIFIDLSKKPLQDMQNSNEISAFSVVIDSAQDVLASSELVISVLVVPYGTARQIKFNIGFSKSV